MLAAEGIGLNRTGISEVITEAGLPRIWRRPEPRAAARAATTLPRARVLDGDDYAAAARRRAHQDRRAAAGAARPARPGPTRTGRRGRLPRHPRHRRGQLPALAARAETHRTRRVSHVHDLAADPGAALFAGLTALPKTTALTTYSYRLQHAKQT